MSQVSNSSAHPKAFGKCDVQRPQFEQPGTKVELAEKVVGQTEIEDQEFWFCSSCIEASNEFSEVLRTQEARPISLNSFEVSEVCRRDRLIYTLRWLRNSQECVHSACPRFEMRASSLW